MTWLRLSAGVFLLTLGGNGALFGIIAMLDPVGAKHADDGDPFGPPQTLLELTAQTGVAATVFSVGLFLVLWAVRRRGTL